MEDTAASQSDRNSDNRFLSRMAVVLFVSGLLIPFLIAAIGRDELALGFAVTAEILALLLGLLSWSERLSKIVAATLLVLVGLGGVATGVYVAVRAQHVQQQARAKAEAERAETMHRTEEMRATGDIERRKAEAAGSGGRGDAGDTAHAHGGHDAAGRGSRASH